MEKERLLIFDFVRALAIILVVIGHYIPDNAPEWYNMINKAIYTFHMPVFLFTSGYIYIATKKKESYHSFLSKKFKRLLIPYFVTSIIIITIKLLTQNNSYVQNPVTHWAYIELFYSPVAGYFLWFVIALWWMFVILPFFKTHQQRFGLFIGSIILAFIPIEFTRIFCFEEFKNMFLFFMFGIITYDYYHVLEKKLRYLSKSIIPIITFILMEFIYLSYQIEWLRYILPFIGIAVIIQISNLLYYKTSHRFGGVLLHLGSASYIIYLFHTTFEGGAKSIILKISHNFTIFSENIVYIFCSIFVILCGLIGPLILHLILKKFKVTRFLFALK